MQSRYISIIVFFSIIIIALFPESYSTKVSKLPYQQPSSFLSPKYEDESFENVSMDICYPILDFNIPPEGADTVHIQNFKEFDTAFKKYFLDGIKMFSSINKTSWLFYKPITDINHEIIEYRTKTKDGSDFYVFLDSSTVFCRNQSNSDFLMMFQMIYTGKIPADSTNPKSKNATIIDIQYLIWNRGTGDLVATDKVNAKMEFDRLVGHWPYRGAIMKTAALIFEKLPMFSK